MATSRASISATSSFTWVDDRTRRTGKFAARIRRPGTFRWSGLALEEWCGPAGELGEGHAVKHILTLHLSEPLHLELSWEGERAKADRLLPGSFSILPARVSSAGHWDRAYHAIALEIAPEMLASIAGETSRGQVELRPAMAISDAVVSSLALALHADAVNGSPCGSAYGESLAIALGAQLVRHHGDDVADSMAAAARGVLSQQAVTRIVDYVDSNLGEDISVLQLADLVHMEPYRFTRRFKRTLGTSPHRYIVERRIALAKTLLRNRDLSLSDVALQVGFSTPNHFSTVFRRLVRVPPSAYRATLNVKSADARRIEATQGARTRL